MLLCRPSYDGSVRRPAHDEPAHDDPAHDDPANDDPDDTAKDRE